jgi:hypothetical protein
MKVSHSNQYKPSIEAVHEIEKNNVTLTCNSDLIEIKGVIPEGIYISKGKYGYAVYSSKHFKKDEFVFRGKFILIDDKEALIKMHLSPYEDQTKVETYNLNFTTHTVNTWNKKRQLYFFDSFMNHSCDPNIVGFCEPENQYYNFALKDIYPGDEITSDYTLFEYDCVNKNILKCECNGGGCLGKTLGFKYLTPEQKKIRINDVDEDIFNLWVQEFKFKPDDQNEGVFVEKLNLPDGFHFTDDEILKASKSFNPRDVLFEGRATIINENTIVIVIINEKKIWLELETDEDLTKNYKGIASFIKNSDKANVQIKMISKNDFQIVAVKSINENDELLCK